jgi:predicted metal-dependent hydrolase
MRIDKPMKEFAFGTRKITYNLHRQDRKRMRIVVSPELTVDVFAPAAANEEQIEAALMKKAAWIAGKLDALERYHPLPTPKKYISGETLVYLGRQYRLKVQQGGRQPAKLRGRYLRVWVEDKEDTRDVKNAVNTWYRKRAHETLGRYLEKCYAIAARHGVAEPVLTIRMMRRRWGSCSPKDRNTLNLNLVKAPVHCIEYVIMHELCHLKYHDHSKFFYSPLTRCQPDWRHRKEILNKAFIF